MHAFNPNSHTVRVFIPLIVHTLAQFRVIFGSIQKHFKGIEKSTGISGSQLWILHEIYQKPNIGVSELSKKLYIHQSTCSLLIEKLLKKGLIIKERSTKDQRKIHLKLDDLAIKIVKKTPGPAEGVLPDALKKLNKKQLTSLKVALDLLIEHLQIKNIDSAKIPLSEILNEDHKK